MSARASEQRQGGSPPRWARVTAKPQPHLPSLKSNREFFAGPRNTEANLSFQECAQLRKIQVFCSLHNGVVISYFEQIKSQPKTHGLCRSLYFTAALWSGRKHLEQLWWGGEKWYDNHIPCCIFSQWICLEWATSVPLLHYLSLEIATS